MFKNNNIIEMLSLVTIAGSLLPHEEIVEVEQLSFNFDTISSTISSEECDYEKCVYEKYDYEKEMEIAKKVDEICAKYADELPF